MIHGIESKNPNLNWGGAPALSFKPGGFKYQPQHLVSDIPASAFEPTAAFHCRPEAEFETHEFFEVDYSFAKQSHSGRLAEPRQVGPLRKILTEKPVGVLIRSSLPGAVRVCKEYRNARPL